MQEKNIKSRLPEEPGLPVAETIAAALKGLRYGSVEIIVHDGRIVQIERQERWRMDIENPFNGRAKP